MKRRLVAIPEDCAEFRMARVGCGEPLHEPWLRSFLTAEPLDPDAYIRELRDAASGALVLTEDLEESEVLVVERLTVDGSMLDRMPAARRIVKYGSDDRNISYAACEERGVAVTVAARSVTASVADHVMMLLLVLIRRFTRGARLEAVGESQVPDARSTEVGGHPETVFNWPGIQGIRPLRGLKFAVLGIGEIGRAVLERAAAFGMSLGYWSAETDELLEQRLGVVRLPFEDVATWADVVSIHLPYAPDLHGLVQRDFLDRLGPDGILINTARGLLVDAEALVAALAQGTLGGAGLDVFPHEPLPIDDPLRRLGNVVLTPHVGAGTRLTILEDVVAVLRAAAAT